MTAQPSEYMLELLRQDDQFALYRGGLTGLDATPVLMLVPISARPVPEALRRIDHEYSLRNELDAEWAAQPFALSTHNGRQALVLRDPGGEPLDRLLQRSIETKRFLRIAISLATALKHLHQRKLIHKDIKPTNILVDPRSDQIWLTGFGIASRVPRERQPPTPPELIAGSLPYMAPEQTGRMNRSIDSRSDLYSMGVVLYEMLTGTLPFMAADPMELVHAHIARPPVPPHERSKDIPGPVSRIVMKLLAKTSEERYQTAAGVERDLRRCLAEFDQRQTDEFPLAEHDTPDRLLIPETLYGRASEIETLLAAFDRVVADGRPELVLVSGYSGVGKSSVVNELHKALVPPRGLFASGKFDQHKREIPYATLVQALQRLVRPLLTKSETELRRWRDAFRDALDPNGQLIVNLLPELRLIVGEQPPVADVAPRDAKARFHVIVRRFIGVFARQEHPLALFFDDLQWLDAATLDLIEDLLTQPDVKHLLLIGAYRDNEVGFAHPLMSKLAAMRRAGALVQDIVLAPLTQEDMERLIAHSVHSDRDHTRTLAEVVHDKTRGNPFFAIQFLSELADEGLLTFDHGEGRWTWDVSRIRAKGYTDNVVDLVIGKLTRMPGGTQDALKQLACLGSSADLTTLSMLYQESNEEFERQLWEAVQAGLVLRSDDSYRFLHDRVREAAYSSIPRQLRAETHLRLGRLLSENTPSHQREQRIFEIVNQLNHATDLITSQDERTRVAELNLIAARRAKLSIAYASALSYLATGRRLLTDESWESDYELTLSLEILTAECELLTGELESAETRLSMLAVRANNAHDLGRVTCLQLTLYTALNRLDLGIEICLAYLRRGGADYSAHPTDDDVRLEYDRIWSLLGDRQIEDLVDAPLVAHPDILDALNVLTELVTPAVFFDANLCAFVVCRIATLSLEYGNGDASCFAYVWLGIIGGRRFAQYKSAFRFAQLGYDLLAKRGLKRYEARTLMCFAVAVPASRHIRHHREIVLNAFDLAYRTGDFTYAAYSCTQLLTSLLFGGAPLAEAQVEAEKRVEFAERARVGLAVDIIQSDLQLIKSLRGLTDEFGSFNDNRFDEARFEHHLAGNPALAIAGLGYWTQTVEARFFARDYASAIEASLKAEQLLWSAPAMLEEAVFRFYSALSYAAACDSTPAAEQSNYLDAVTANHRQLTLWAEHCPENFEAHAALVGAEIARIEGRLIDAESLYEAAIRSAHGNGFVHNEAVAYEVAARFYAARGFDKFADAYLREARYSYLRWGADGKVRQLDELYPQLKKEEPSRATSNTIVAPAELLDLATVIKVSQAVSGEMVLEKLVDRVMRAAIEHAGAERGLLIVPRGDDLRLEAEATTSLDGVRVRLHGSATDGAFPESLVRYVMRTHEPAILDDSSSSSPLFLDRHLAQRGARSVLALPLINRAKLNGVLYLENSLAAQAFTPERITVLKVLASQAAIALENTRLYNDLENRGAEIRQLRDQLYRENLALREEVDRASMFEEIVGSSSALKSVLSRVAKVAPTDSTVFITGETGTGKELVARALHKRSRRSGRPFVSVSCAALAPSLISSELFGHEKGAFTGATQRRLGRFELADGGTIFLDEVGELLPETQVALLRVLQEREFERVGGTQSIRVDVRLIAATNRDLRAAVANGTFRQDLFYRLNVFPIEVPPLRERKQDVLMLVEYFLHRYASRAAKKFRSIDKKTLDLLRAYDWPGNIRELQNVIERSVILSVDDVFSVDKLWLSTEPSRSVTRVGSSSVPIENEPDSEREIIEAALAETRGRVAGRSGAAAKLRIPPSTLESRIKALRIRKNLFKFR